MKKREKTTQPRETAEQQKHRFKILTDNPELYERAKQGNIKAQKHLQALIDKTEIDPEWLVEDPIPEPARQDLKVKGAPNFTTIVSVLGDCLKVIMKDEKDYYTSVDFIKINEVSRVSYNVIQNELILILPETMGSIEEAPVRIKGANGKETGGIRYSTYGQTGPFKIVLVGTDTIRLFLEKWLNIGTMSDEDFEGFVEHKKANEKFEAALEEIKKKEEDAAKEKQKKQPGKILDMHGVAAKPEDEHKD